MVLPLVLLVLVLLGLLAASSGFYVHADLRATQSIAMRLQARMAAEAGLQKVMLSLRTERDNVAYWYHNPEEFHRVIVYSELGGLEALGRIDEYEEGDVGVVWRFSVVSDDPLDDESLVRYGVTDESSKLNINVASRGQLMRLIEQFATEEMNIDELVDALLDWRDGDRSPRPFGAEDAYYAQLETPYAVKNAAFETTEELLLVRGFTGALFYGEDYDRNGLLSPNEDDGDLTFPPDDADGILNRGLLPYITVWSRDINSASDNQSRVYLYNDQGVVLQQVAGFLEDQEKINFIGEASVSEPKLKSPAELLNPLPREEGEPLPSPMTEADLPWIMDRITVTPNPESIGLINVNTAPPIVLGTLEALTPEDVDLIVTTRAELDEETRKSTGWLAPVVGGEKFGLIADKITARATRFHVEVIGFADHVGTMTRLEAILEMRGPIAQIIYLRDLTTLGTTFPVQYAEGDAELEGFDG
jgi:type II secretory pathway component PulK